MEGPEPPARPKTLRDHLYETVFESDTPAGKAFDVALLLAIGVSVMAVVLESVHEIAAAHGPALRAVEWGVTLLFTLEYLLRVAVVRHPLRYVTSFFGIVDLLAILPTYASLVLPEAHTLLVVRAVRLLRAFRILKMVGYVREARILVAAVQASSRKIAVFVGTILTIVVIVGALMYVVEGPEHGFDNIPLAMYWAIVTLSTVGFGDITPGTPLGKLLASVVMVLGYGIIAVPTGIVTVELAHAARDAMVSGQACPSCGRAGHDPDARFCKYCGAGL